MAEWIFGIPERGDHIRVARRGYYHHGIYIGGGEVVHYSAPDGDGVELSPEAVTVRRDSIRMFAAGGNVELRRFSRRERRGLRSPEETAEYAERAIGRGGYDILYNNCEHFAQECLGEKAETQIDEMRRKIREKLGISGGNGK